MGDHHLRRFPPRRSPLPRFPRPDLHLVPPLVPLADPARVLRINIMLVTWVNAATALALITADPGPAPSVVLMATIAPLPLWGVLYAVVAALLILGRYVAAHTIAAALWLFWGFGAVVGLVAGTTRSPLVSAVLAILIVTTAGFHINGLTWRRREAQARRDR